jgi:hypothetical protein
MFRRFAQLCVKSSASDANAAVEVPGSMVAHGSSDRHLEASPKRPHVLSLTLRRRVRWRRSA